MPPLISLVTRRNTRSVAPNNCFIFSIFLSFPQFWVFFTLGSRLIVLIWLSKGLNTSWVIFSPVWYTRMLKCSELVLPDTKKQNANCGDKHGNKTHVKQCSFTRRFVCYNIHLQKWLELTTKFKTVLNLK